MIAVTTPPSLAFFATAWNASQKYLKFQHQPMRVN